MIWKDAFLHPLSAWAPRAIPCLPQNIVSSRSSHLLPFRPLIGSVDSDRSVSAEMSETPSLNADLESPQPPSHCCCLHGTTVSFTRMHVGLFIV